MAKSHLHTHTRDLKDVTNVLSNEIHSCSSNHKTVKNVSIKFTI